MGQGEPTFYTGSVSGSSGLTSLIGSGSGRFRYNSDESATNYTTSISSGKYAIFREQPSATIASMTPSMTYGDSLPSLSATGNVNGDLPTYDIASRTDSATGNINAGSYSIDSSNLANLGYSVTGGPSGTLTVNSKVISLTVADKVYDGTTSLTGQVSITTGISSGGITEDLNYENAVSNNKNVVTAQSKYLSGITLTDGVNGLAANYTTPTLDRDNSAAVTITPKQVKLSASKVFDGTTTLSSVNIFTDGDDGYLGGETLTFSGAHSTSIHVENGSNRIRQITLEDGTDGNGGIATNYELPEDFTTSNAPVTITVKTLTPTLTNTGVTKEYDGTVSAPSNFTPTYSFVGLVSGDNDASLSHIDANYDNANVGTGKTLTVTGLTINSIGGDGSRAGNPSFPPIISWIKLLKSFLEVQISLRRL